MYEMNIEKIHNSIMNQIINVDLFCLCDSEDEQREQELENRINNIMALDEDFKRKFNNDLQVTMAMANTHSFEQGLRIGLSLLQNLLTAEPPELHITKHEPNRTERRCPPLCQQSNTRQVFIDYVSKYCRFLSDEQIYLMQGKIEQLFTDNIKKFVNDLF